MKDKLVIEFQDKQKIDIAPNLFTQKLFSRFFIPLINDLNKDEIIKVKLPNLKSPLYMRAKTSDILNAEEIFINEDYNLDIIFEVNTIIDAGANVGFASIYFTSRFPKSNILAIEPEKSNFKILRKNIRPYKNIKALNLGIWNKKTNLIISNKTKAENWGFMVEETDKSKYDTKAITINDCMNLMNWTAIDILKIDIEGSEKEVFSHNYERWLGQVKCIIIELHEKMRKGSIESVDNAIKYYNFKEIKLQRKYAKHMRILINKDFI